MNKNMGRFRWNIWLGGCLLALASAVVFLCLQNWPGVWTCLGTVVLVSLPVMLPRLLDLQFSRGFYLCCMLYALGPMLGKAFGLYYLTPWWDKLLHILGGVVFGIIGTGIASARGCGRGMSVWFGLFFSVAVAGIWELIEFGIDWFFGVDMQSDTVMDAIHSYLLSDQLGEMGSIEGIRQVRINGAPLPLEGYLDIGLVDTMLDMLVESLGAVFCGVWLGLTDRPIPVALDHEKNNNFLRKKVDKFWFRR